MPQTCLLSIYLQFWQLKWQEINAMLTSPDLRTFIHTEWDSRSDKMFLLEEKSRLQKRLPLPSQHAMDGTKWKNGGRSGFCGDKNLNTMALCSQPTNQEGLIPFAPISSSATPCTSTYWAWYFTAVTKNEEFGQYVKSSTPWFML